MYCFIKRLHLISSFKITRSLFVPYAYVFIESIDGIILSPFEPKTFLLTFPVKTLCLSLLKLCSVLNIDFFVIYEFFRIFLKLYTSASFPPYNLYYFEADLLYNSLYNFEIQVFFL